MQPSQLQPIQLSPPQISSQQQPQAFRQSEHAKIEASTQAKAIGNVNSPQDSGTIGHGSKQKRYCTKEQIYNHDIIYINSDEFSSSPSFLKMSYQNTPVLVKRMNSLNANNAVNCCQESHDSEKLINNKLFSTISCNYKSTDLVEQYDMDGNAFNQTKQLPNHRQNIQTQITKGNMENTMKVGRNGKENNENIQHVRYKTRRTSSLAQVDLNNYNLQNLIQLVDNMYERAVDKKIQCNIQVSLSAKKLANFSSAIQKQECPRQSKIIEKQPVFIEIQKLKLMRKCREECKQKYGNNRSGKLEIDEQQIIKEEDEQDRGPTMTQRISIQILPDGEDADYRCIEEEEDAQQCYSRGASSQLNSQLSSVHYQQIISEASSVEQNQNQNERKNKILKVTVKAADQKKQERCGRQLDNKQWESINNQMKKIRQHESNGKKNLIKAYMREPHHQNCHQNNYQTQQQSYSGFRQQTKQQKIENSCKYSYLDNQKSIKQCSVSQVDSSRRSRTDAKTKFNQQLTQRAKNYNFGQQPTNNFSKGQSQTNQTATAIHSHNYKGVYEQILSQYSTARLLAISKHQYINGQQSAAKAGMSAPKSQRSSSVSLKVQRQQMVKRDRRGDGGKGDWNMKQEQRGGRLNSERKLRSSSNPKQREVMTHNKDSSKFGLCFVGDNLEVCKIGGLARNLKYF